MAAFHLEAEDAALGHDTDEVDLALELAPMVSDVEGVEDGPAGGVGAGAAGCAGPAGLRRVHDETLEDELLAVARRVRRNRGRNQAHEAATSVMAISSPLRATSGRQRAPRAPPRPPAASRSSGWR